MIENVFFLDNAFLNGGMMTPPPKKRNVLVDGGKQVKKGEIPTAPNSTPKIIPEHISTLLSLCVECT